jgi:hypothetical protein
VTITNYTQLKTAIATFLRPDTTLNPITTAMIPEFIAGFEGELNGTVAWVGLEIDVTLVAVAGSEVVTTPSDYESPVALWYERTLVPFVPPGKLPPAWNSGKPSYWTIKGADISMDVTADSAFELTFRYRQAIALSDANPTNTVLTNYPTLYLYGSLIQSAPFQRDLAMIETWRAYYDRAEERMMAAENLSNGLVLLPVDAGIQPRHHRFNINEG